MPIPQPILNVLKNENWFFNLFSHTHSTHRILRHTLETIYSDNPLWKETANANLQNWHNNKPSLASSQPIIVKEEDWGTLLFNQTRQSGQLFTVLNHCSKDFPGGGVFEGGTAQEEDIGLRSTFLSMLNDKTITYYDEGKNEFKYTSDIKALIDGLPFTSQEEDFFRDQFGLEHHSPLTKVFLPEDTFVLLRAAAFYKNTDSRSGIAIEYSISYGKLPSESYVPFKMLNSSAPDLSNRPKFNELPQSEQADIEDELRKKISAQLDTLMLKGLRHLILGAWGCGSYKNDPHLVAKIYYDELKKRDSFFDTVIFAIKKTSFKDNENFEIFHEQFSKDPIILRPQQIEESYTMKR